jgi:hypothetical protein
MIKRFVLFPLKVRGAEVSKGELERGSVPLLFNIKDRRPCDQRCCVSGHGTKAVMRLASTLYDSKRGWHMILEYTLHTRNLGVKAFRPPIGERTRAAVPLPRILQNEEGRSANASSASLAEA